MNDITANLFGVRDTLCNNVTVLALQTERIGECVDCEEMSYLSCTLNYKTTISCWIFTLTVGNSMEYG